MPVTSIITQPDVNDLKAVYRPVIFVVRATRTDGQPAPPVMYCDVYVNGVYYKSQEKTQYQNLNTSNSDWQFDIQDACQEVLEYQIATNGGSSLVTTSTVMATIYVKFRSSGYDTNGFITPEGTAPVQGTGTITPVAGDGTKSNSFFVALATLQHDQNQDMATHLNYYRQNETAWASNVNPLTHRGCIPGDRNYKLCEGDSDYFPFVMTQDYTIGCTTLWYTNKDGSTGRVSDCSSATTCPVIGDITGSGTAQTSTWSLSITAIPWSTAPSAAQNVIVAYREAGTSTAFTTVGTYSVNTDGSVTALNITGIDDSWSAIEVQATSTCDSSTFTKTFDQPACVPVGITGTPVFPNAVTGIAYDFDIELTGSAPFVITFTGPSWMAYSIAGSDVNFSGTPASDDVIDSTPVSITITNCVSGSVTIANDIAVTAGTPVAVVLTRSGNTLSVNSDFGTGPYHIIFSGSYSGGSCPGEFSFASGNQTGVSTGSTSTTFTFTAYSGVSYFFTCEVIDSSGTSGYSNTVTVSACLVPETEIEMKDGSKKQLRHLLQGEELAYGNSDKEYINKVTSFSKHIVDKLYNINNGLLRCSEGHRHPLFDGNIVESLYLHESDLLIDRSGNFFRITDITIEHGTFEVIDISTSTEYYIANGVLTHNKIACP